MFPDQFGAQQVAVPRQGAEADNAADVRVIHQLSQVADVDQQLRRGQTHVQAGQQALAAGNRNGVAVGVLKDLIGVSQRRRSDIAKASGLHANARPKRPSRRAVRRPAWIRFHEPAGNRVERTPWCRAH